ncbi:MAG TPA: alpha/beta hydrolase [Alphaproteobacteria bacterium]|nr:alpha/beta hydrolase [Alphaproteobacteria bacterium]
MAYEIGTYSIEGGGFMRYARLNAPKPSRGCVLIGLGWAEWLEKYAGVAEDWAQRGFDVVAVEWRGQALSSRFLERRDRAWHASFDVLVDDLDAFVRWYFQDDQGPLLLMGHSLGAHLLLRWYIEKTPPHNIIRGVMLLSPMQRVNTKPFAYRVAQAITSTAMFLRLGQRFAPGQGKFDPVNVPFAGNQLTHSEARYNAMILALRENPLLKAGGITYGWLSAAFRSANKLEARLKLGAPKGPYLVIGPEQDPLVETEGMRKIAKLLPNCTAQFFAGAAHELLEESDDIREKTWAAIDAFIKRVLPAEPN